MIICNECKMSPLGRLLHKPNEKTRKSAILILFYHYQNELYIPLILRPKYDGVHGGQMAFPGGRMEKTDQSLIFTALREAQEEIGIKVCSIVSVICASEYHLRSASYTCSETKPAPYL